MQEGDVIRVIQLIMKKAWTQSLDLLIQVQYSLYSLLPNNKVLS